MTRSEGMIYRNFRAPTYKEAVVKAKMEMGNDMYIIGRKEVKEGGIFGLFAQNLTEITVARNEESTKNETGKIDEGLKKKATVKETDSEVMKELLDIKKKLNTLMAPPKEEEENINLKRILCALRENDFSYEYIETLKHKFEDELTVKEANDPSTIEEKLKSYILDSIETSGPIELGKDRPNVVVLVGPTGVGKTTTIAKLAASYGILQKHKVEILTIDSYRIAAIEQLGKYAELMQLPFSMINSREEFKSKVSSSNSELIFVDTAGRSQKNSMGLAELRTILDGVTMNLDIHLVISATTKWKDALDIMTRFNQLMYSKIIITKLDETNTIGSLLSILDTDKKISYFTTGQGVPDDIELAVKEKLLDMLVLDSLDTVQSG
ncbi:MAG: flagellar biosynthesis protein FlhF [Spirochaetota bacterium]|nr:MAG: flagellar biosynthesis protein FlhF [Spirochaetota bacterium]